MRKMFSQKQIELMAKGIADAVAEGFLEDVIEGAEAGTLVNLLGLDSDGGLKKQAVGDAVLAVVAGAEAGTIQDVLGLDENGDLVKGGIYLESIKDSDGHYRFIEGNGIVSTAQTGFTSTYAKWSLSGTHIMLVVAGAFADTTSIIDSPLCKFDVPSWILDKVVPTYAAHIEDKSFEGANDAGSSAQTLYFGLTKASDGLYIIPNALTTMTDKRNVRIQFDLLIDNA